MNAAVLCWPGEGSPTRRFSFPEFHYVTLGIMALAVAPVFGLAHLPLRINLMQMAAAYWIGTSAHALFLAIVLAVLGLPLNETVMPVIEHYRQQKVRVLFLLCLAAFLVRMFGGWLGFILVVDAIAIAELLDRNFLRFGERVLDVLFPSLYLFFAVVLTFVLNHGIAGMKYAGAWDGYFNQLDARLFGVTVPAVAEWSKLHLPSWFWSLSAAAYFALYAQVGAGIALIALDQGRERALRYVGTIVTAYVLAVLFFFFLPTIGPFALRAHPILEGQTYTTQTVIAVRARLIWQHIQIPELASVDLPDYYIGFPSMHVALPAITLWFLRKRKRVVGLLIALDLLLVMGIVLYEWHYFVDILGGIAVAAIAIAVTSREEAFRKNQTA